jgi:integrase
VPSALQQSIGKKIVSISLHTRDQFTAVSLVRSIIPLQQRLGLMCMSSIDDQKDEYEKFTSSVHQIFVKSAAEFIPANIEELNKLRKDTSTLSRWLGEGSLTKDGSFSGGGYFKNIDELLQTYLKMTTPQIDWTPFELNNEERERFYRDLIPIVQHYMKDIQSRLDSVEIPIELPSFLNSSSSVIPPLSAQPPAQPLAQPPAQPPVQSKQKISERLPSFVNWKKSNKTNMNKDSINAYSEAVNDLIFILGDLRIDEYNFDSAQHFKDVLKQLPPHRSKGKVYKSKTLDELLNMNIDKVFSNTTIGRKLDKLRSIFKWLVQTGELTLNPFDLVKEKSNKQSWSKYSEDDLASIFTSDLYKPDSSYYKKRTTRAGMWWLPLLMLYTGARPGELNQLNVADVKEQDGIFYFDLKDGDEKQLKSSAAKRLVPIHSQLLSLGFMDYVDELKAIGHDRVLYSFSLNPKLKPSKLLTSWYTERYRSKYLPENFKADKKALYSFRSTHITNAINKGARLEVVQSYVGHEPEQFGATKYYYRGESLSEVKKSIDLVSFSFIDEIDLAEGWRGLLA